MEEVYFVLYYEKIPEYATLFGESKFNGNIAGIEWRTPGIEYPTKANGYMFGYDCQNRLEGAFFFSRNLGADVIQWQDLFQSTTNNYGTVTGIGSEKNITYDKNGNILTLSRKCQRSNEIVNFDNLTYDYDGNKLIRVRETIKGQNDMKDFPYYNPDAGTAASFIYDANGNLTRDIARNINITYNNWLDLPYSIQFETGRLVYTYGYNGLKTGKKAYNKYNQLTLDEQYFGDLVTNRGIPIRILHDDGYIELNSQMSPTFYYYLKDHLGNVRVVFTPNTDNTPAYIQANDYYPFGLAYSKNLPVQGGSGTTTTTTYVNKFLYNGKEEQDMPGKWLDYGARFYDTQVGRWHSVDNKAEKYPFYAPYAYAINNPILFIDPDGNDIVIYYKENGQDKSYRFNGSTTKGTPNIKFVSQVLKAWNYNVGNGGGAPSFEAATNSDITINVVESNAFSYSSDGNVFWNPNTGGKSTNGIVRSPASVLDHELDHMVDFSKNPINNRERTMQKNYQYGTNEEERVITGSEQETAKANGEISDGQVTRTNHGGHAVVTEDVNSNKVNNKATYDFYKNISKETPYDVDKYIKMYEKK
jgi:RHS repeat-associated protein